MQFANDDGTYDDENMVTYLVQANEEENLLELYDPDSLDLTATLEPYEADGDESDYNQTYQDMGDILTESVIPVRQKQVRLLFMQLMRMELSAQYL